MFPVIHSDLCREHFSTSAIPAMAMLNSNENPEFLVWNVMYGGLLPDFIIMEMQGGELCEARNQIMCFV
jgi:hypothetical protein